MNEGQLSFTMDYDQFIEILDQNNWSKLQDEFKLNNAVLSQTFLIWGSNSDNTWLLADFETKKNYDIEGNRQTEKPNRVKISESSTEKEQLMEPKDPQLIFSQIDRNPLGTDEGYIYFLTQLKINLGELNLEPLKRPDLSGAGFGFESVHNNLIIVVNMFSEILTSTNESLIVFSRKELKQVVSHLKQFYDHLRQIGKFDMRGENPRDNYNNILTSFNQFCESMKMSLRSYIAYLNSKKVDQLGDQVNTTLTAAREKINTAIEGEREELHNLTEEIKQQTTEVLQKSEEKLEEIEQAHLKYQNQLAEKPISQYKAIFANQAEKHKEGAQFWMWMAGAATVSFVIVFFLVSIVLKTEGTQLVGILQNLFAKGLLLSPIYVWLNRSIKNHTAQKHLEVINIHRQNALETFDTFVAAAEGNRETRDAVLLAATKAIFDANQSGYLSTKSSGSDTASPVQQIFKEVIPSKSPSDSS